jgi:HEAT repeat protein
MLFRLLNTKTFAMHLFLLLIFVACVAKLDVPKTESIKNLKHYTGLSVPANRDYWTSAGVKVEVGDNLLIMASGTATISKYFVRESPSKALMVKIGDSYPMMYEPKFYKTISTSGELKFIVPDKHHKDNAGSFRIDVFVIAKGREIYLSDILNDFLAQNPEDEVFKTQLDQLYLANIKEIKHKSTIELETIWKNTISNHLRTDIVWELEKRGSIDSLINILSTFDKSHYKHADLWDSATISNLTYILNSIKRLEAPEAIKPVSKFLENPKFKVRWQALETLGAIKAPKSIDAISMALYDQDDQIRLKVIQSLESVGHPKAMEPLSILLADDNKDVRIKAELTLKKLGASEGQISDWKKKAKTITLDDLYKQKVTYQKAISEKQALQARLKSEADVKQKLEQSLVEGDLALKKKEQLVQTLYENERELKSKLAQLNIAQQQSQEYQENLERLSKKVQLLNEELKQAKTQKDTENAKEELDKALEEKSSLEKEATSSKAKESVLLNEIATLNALAEKTRQDAEIAQKEIEDLRIREKQLAAQVDDLKRRLNRGIAPIIVVAKPQNDTIVKLPTTVLHVIAVDDKGISQLNVTLNNRPVKLTSTRGIELSKIDERRESKKIDITERLELSYGANIIKISATDTDGISIKEDITIIREKDYGEVWAVVIGINQYPNARKLKYAVNDAQAFKNYLKDYIGVPDSNIFFLTDQNATKENIQRLLGTKLKRKASREDTVIIFYAGHGAIETDPANPDGDGFEKYLLPYNADLNDLYTTSISMDEIQKIFQRILAERLIFIADTCYSGASGGRTMLAAKTRASLSDRFYDRISKGRGRVIISSCSANEVSKEDDSLQHGIFSYYMLEGLKGKADQDGDGIITVSELFSYICRKVPEASAQDQHPVRKGETEGELVIGRTK